VKSGAREYVTVWLGGCGGVKNANQMMPTTKIPIAAKPTTSTMLRFRFAFFRDMHVQPQESLIMRKDKVP
jgi:hypothetical protein